jgi:hypothetical protein
MLLPVIAIFVYNRPIHTKRLLESLIKCDGYSNYQVKIFGDGQKNSIIDNNVIETRKVVHDFMNDIHIKNVEFFCKEKNAGLADSIINGVSEILKNNTSIIVLEDDLILDLNFLTYMSNSLEKYKDKKNIGSITGYCFPFLEDKFENKGQNIENFILPRAMSWGWATWNDRWFDSDWTLSDYNDFMHNHSKKTKFSEGGEDLLRMLALQKHGKISSWAIRWNYSHFLHSRYCVYPTKSLVKNHGFDGTGQHCKKTNKYDVSLKNSISEIHLNDELNLNVELVMTLKNYHKVPLYKKILTRFGF